MIQQITPVELHNELQNSPQDIFILDVREQHEYDIAHIGGALIPVNALAQRVSEIDFSKKVVVLCHHGIRSTMAVDWLTRQGYDNIYNLTGGIDAWSVAVDPSLARY